MITKLSLTQFRNFLSREFFFNEGINIIVWDNGKWKSNILEALCLLNWTGLNGKPDMDHLCTGGTDFFALWIETNKWSSNFFYDKSINKKAYSINNKKSSKKKLVEFSSKAIVFTPIMMNMMYLSPSLRRDFLDQTLCNCFSDYTTCLKEYKKVLTSRNKILKNISKWLSTKNELQFWNDSLITNASKIYEYRALFVWYVQDNSHILAKHLIHKIKGLSFIYKSTIALWSNYKDTLTQLVAENLEKDIMMRSTSFWPHRDDFVIETLSWQDITHYWSRWEIKTLILALKNLETSFTEISTHEKPILIVDDLLSELDEKNQHHFLQSVENYQVFITSISPIKDFKQSWTIIKLT